MNRLLITQTGEQLRHEMKQQSYSERIKKPIQVKQAKLPELVRQTTALFIETERDNALYQKSLSEIALSNLSRAASLSLLGSRSKKQLEAHIREELNLPTNFQYLNHNLEKQINKILYDKGIHFYYSDLKTKRKRQLVCDLKRIEKQRTVSNNGDVSRFSQCIEEFDKNAKMTAIINAEGKLAQLTRRYKQKEINDQKLKINLSFAFDKMQERKNMLIDAINPLSPTQMRQASQKEFDKMFYDNSEERFLHRVHEKHLKQIKPIWEQHQFPQQTKRWQQYIENAKRK